MYYTGEALDEYNTVILDATVNSVGTWIIVTNMANGYSFSGSGTFTSTGTVQITLNGSGTPLTAQTDIFTAQANGSGGTCTFSVTVASLPPCGTPISYGGQSYNTVQIGSQCWMAANLNIGTMINGNSNQTNNGIIEKYCYGNSTANCNVYGGLYQWNEMMQYSLIPGDKGICPSGWHLPTDAEWCTLEQEVDPSIPCAEIGWRGVNGGGKLKEAGTTHWLSPNTGATNSSGFTALPGGTRSASGIFSTITNYGNFWSASSSGWFRGLYYNNAQVNRGYINDESGLSVRCIRNN